MTSRAERNDSPFVIQYDQSQAVPLRMDFRRNYEILELVTEGETKTFRARQVSTGRPVLVHQLLNPVPAGQADLNSMVLRFVREAPPESLAQVLDMVEHENSLWIVMGDLPAFRNFRQWLESEIQKMKISPAPLTKTQESSVETKPRQPAAVESPVEAVPSPGEFTRFFHMQAQPKASTSPVTAEEPIQPVAPATHPLSPQSSGEFTRVFNLHEQPKASPPPATMEQPTLPAVSQVSPAREEGRGEFTSLFGSSEHSTPSKAPLSSVQPSSPLLSASPPASPESPRELTRLFEPPGEAGVVQKAPVVRSNPPEPMSPPPAPPARQPGEYTRLFGGSAPTPKTPQPSSPPSLPPAPVRPALVSPGLPAMPSTPRITKPAIPPKPKMDVPLSQGAPGITTPSSASVVSKGPKAPSMKIKDSGQLPRSERPPLLPLIIILGSVFLLALGLVIYFVLKH
jgi:hypothetical protein